MVDNATVHLKCNYVCSLTTIEWEKLKNEIDGKLANDTQNENINPSNKKSKTSI